MMHLLKEVNCNRCERPYKSLLTHKTDKSKICGKPDCFEVYQDLKIQRAKAKKLKEVLNS
jgi:hypothetical protein